MDDTAKYLIHASITADGVVERSDVVGAIFGQTEGLLGDELDLRDLQQSSKVGRIDVEIESENGQSYGHVTITSSLDKVETAILAASLETISRVGPCQSTVTVTDIEDVREAKRREVVERAKELLTESFDDSVMTSTEILEEVRESVRVEAIADYGGLPAGPRVADSDAIVVVEGRADVLTLLRYGVKNAIAVEGTNIPETVADLSRERTVTAFLDGDRGGELILRELAQVGDVDYVAFAPEGRSVEDLARHELISALRDKVSFESLPAEGNVRAAAAPPDEEGAVADPPRESSGTTDSAPATPAADETTGAADASSDEVTDGNDGEAAADESTTASSAPAPAETDGAGGATADAGGVAVGAVEPAASAPGDVDAGTISPSGTDSDATGTENAANGSPTTLREHVRSVVDDGTTRVRLLDNDLTTLAEAPAAEAFDALTNAERVPYAVVLDDELSQRLLDAAAQRGVEHVVARSEGKFVKKPVDVRVRTADQLV